MTIPYKGPGVLREFRTDDLLGSITLRVWG